MSLGLRGKIALLYVVAILLIIGSSVLLSITSLTDAFNVEYREKGLAIARTFDAQYNSLAEIQDSELAQAQIDRLVTSDPRIHNISLYIPVGNEVIRTASSDKSQIGALAEAHDVEPILTGRTVFYDRVKEDQKLVEVLAPLRVNGKPVASIGVYLRLAPRDEVVRGQAMRFAYIGIVAAALLLVVLYLSLDRLLLKPLSLLKHSAQAIERGWLNTRTSVQRSDEIGELAIAFNNMADTLEKRDEENQELHLKLEAQYAEAQEQAITDPVTALFNHRHFHDRLANELERARRFDTSLALLFADIDNFKAVNDSHGHQFGDQVLREIAHLLKGTVREIDTVARYGGEEFAIILPGTDRRAAVQIGERILRVVAGYRFGGDPDLPDAITVSVGAAAYPEDGLSREDLIWKADRAMYYAKRLGRNQVRAYNELTEAGVHGAGQADEELPIEEPYESLIQSLAAAVDARDLYDRSHSRSVARLATSIANAMGIRGTPMRDIAMAGLLHDLGKIDLPDSILGKAGPLSTEKWHLLREHASAGETMVKPAFSLAQILPLIAFHEERFDGSGYPHGLAGDQIPLGARILAVADAYHAMTSFRPYRSAKSHGESIVELRLGSGTQFDPAVVEAFIGVLEHDLDAGHSLDVPDDSRPSRRSS